MSSNIVNGEKKLLKILMLHGYQQNQQMFRDKTGGIRKTVKNIAELIYCEAPHDLSSLEPIKNTQNDQAESQNESRKAWWYKSKDFHDHNQTHLLKDVENTLLHMNDVFGRMGPFDGVWGFSMGGELATFLSKISIQNKQLNNENNKYENIKFNFVIITASAQSSETLLDFYYDLNNKFEIDSLHVVGKTDKLVEYERSLKLTDYFVGPQVYMHDLGHFIPNNAESKIVYVEFLNRMLDKHKLK